MLSSAKAEGTGSVGDGVARGCPRFQVASRDHHVTIYEPGRAGDGLGVMHRGEITRTARECHIEGNRVTVKYGFSGRILLGPRGRPGSITLPLQRVRPRSQARPHRRRPGDGRIDRQSRQADRLLLAGPHRDVRRARRRARRRDRRLRRLRAERAGRWLIFPHGLHAQRLTGRSGGLSSRLSVEICGRDRRAASRVARRRRRSNRPGTSQAKGPQIDDALESSRWQGRLTEGVRSLAGVGRRMIGISQVP